MPRRGTEHAAAFSAFLAAAFVGCRFLLAAPWAGVGNGVQVLVAVVMFCIGTLLPRDEVDAVFRKWPLVLTGTAIQYITMPLLALTMVHLFSVHAETAAGIMIVGCVPGAMASNVLTMTARGNVSYSVSLTTSATLLSPLIVPLVLKATVSDDVDYDGTQAVIMLTLTVVLPVVAGQLLRRFARFAPPHANMIANLAILGIIAIAVGLQRDRLVRDQPLLSIGMLGLILLLINLGGYLAGYLGGYVTSLPEPMRRALTLEVGMQNAGAGTGLAIHLFGNESPAIVPCILYTFGCMLTGTVLASLWNWLGNHQRREEDSNE